MSSSSLPRLRIPPPPPLAPSSNPPAPSSSLLIRPPPPPPSSSSSSSACSSSSVRPLPRPSSSSVSSSLILPSQTLYCNNLNDKLRLEDLISCLYEFFCPYGHIIDIVSQRGIKKRGQAFVVFRDVSSSTAALRASQGREFLGKIIRIQFAKTKSHAVLELEGNFKVKRLRAHQQRMHQQQKAALNALADETEGEGEKSSTMIIDEEDDGRGGKRNKGNEEERRGRFGEENENSAEISVAAERKQRRRTVVDGGGAIGCLCVSNLPSIITEFALDTLFGQYGGYIECRIIEGRSLAFVDYETGMQAEVAMQQLNGFKITEEHALELSYVGEKGTSDGREEIKG